MRFEVDQKKAREARRHVAGHREFPRDDALRATPITQYRERDKLISVDLRAPRAASASILRRLATLAMPTPNGPVPLGALGASSCTAWSTA